MFKRVKNNFSTQFSFRFENQSATFFSNFFFVLSLSSRLPFEDFLLVHFVAHSSSSAFPFLFLSRSFCAFARHVFWHGIPCQTNLMPCLALPSLPLLFYRRAGALLFVIVFLVLWILWCRSAAGCTTELIAQSSSVLNARSSLFLFYTLNGGPLVGRQHATYYTFHVELYAQNNNKKRRTLHSSTPSRTMHGDG